ncbi:MAG: hypothetical protein KJ607_08570 [Bacteroidetes bacterium]|nr:hypothetical protein [Bacteroidota bacterium]
MIFIIFRGICHSQDTVLFLNGRTLVLSAYKFDTERQLLLYKNRKGRMKWVEKDFIFSIRDSCGIEKIYYHPDTIERSFLSVSQMRSFAYGQRDAYSRFKAPGAAVSGFTVGAASPFALYVWYSFIPSLAVSAVYEIVPVRMKRIEKKCPDKIDDIFYLQGFRETANRKRVLNAVIGTGAGFVTGVAAALIIGTVRNMQSADNPDI